MDHVLGCAPRNEQNLEEVYSISEPLLQDYCMNLEHLSAGVYWSFLEHIFMDCVLVLGNCHWNLRPEVTIQEGNLKITNNK